MYSIQGKLVSIIRTADVPQPLSKSDLEKLPVTSYRANATESEIQDAKRRNAAASHTKTWPSYDRIMPDLSGRLWVQHWTATPMALEPTGWTAFDASGKMLGRLIIPAPDTKERRQLVVSFGKDEVFVKRSDDDGAWHYLAYPLLSKK